MLFETIVCVKDLQRTLFLSDKKINRFKSTLIINYDQNIGI